MKLSESLRKNILSSTGGGIIYRFKVLSRRNVIFFDEIFMPYIGKCEKSGKSEAIESVGREWMNLCFSAFLPSELRKLPSATFLNLVMKKVWHNLGLLDDLVAKSEGNLIKVMTKNEKITMTIGKNVFLPGLYMGALDVLCGSKVETEEIKQTTNRDEWNLYVFRLTDKPPAFSSKDRIVYKNLNEVDIKGFALSNAVKSGIFQIKEDNRIYFRGKQLSVVENTVFHLFGNRGLLMDELARISFGMFEGTISKGSSADEKLNLLKTLLQAMGWGQVKIALANKSVALNITCPPHGLQLAEDNWKFLAHSVLGYMFLINRDSRISSLDYFAAKSCLKISYEL
jgi:hypothetical protein